MRRIKAKKEAARLLNDSDIEVLLRSQADPAAERWFQNDTLQRVEKNCANNFEIHVLNKVDGQIICRVAIRLYD